ERMQRSGISRDDMVRRSFTHILRSLLICTFSINCAAKASDVEPSFSEWHDVMEKAFRNLQGQEDKLLDADSAKTLTSVKGLITTARPDEGVVEAQRKSDPRAVAALEACRNALMLGAVLRLKVLGRLPPGRDNPLNVDGDVPFDRYARLYIGFAETCEDG